MKQYVFYVWHYDLLVIYLVFSRVELGNKPVGMRDEASRSNILLFFVCLCECEVVTVYVRCGIVRKEGKQGMCLILYGAVAGGVILQTQSNV